MKLLYFYNNEEGVACLKEGVRTMQRSFLFKIVLIGDGAVGKTSLRKRWMGEGFEVNYIFTIGCDFAIKELQFNDNIRVKLQIWDLGGQPHFREVRKAFYVGASGGIVLYDITNRQSFENVRMWVAELIKHAKKKVPIVVVGNKIDLRENKGNYISTLEGLELKRRIVEEFGIKALFSETSAKTGENVDKVFRGMTALLLQELGVIKPVVPEPAIDERYAKLLSEICKLLGLEEETWRESPEYVLQVLKHTLKEKVHVEGSFWRKI